MTPEQLAEIQSKIEKLEREVKELRAWKESKQKQQLSNPVDYASQKLIKQAAS